jgi:hypothetical protein
MNGIHSAARMQATGQNGSSRHGGDLISAVTTATIVSRPARGAADAALGFSHMLPVSLLPLAAIAIDGLRAQASDDPAATPALAGWLGNLAYRLNADGRREEALETATEGAALHRQLAEASPPPTVRTWPRRRLSAARVLHPGGTVTYPGLSVTRRQRGFTQFTRPVFPLPAAQGRRKDCFGFFPGLRTRASRTRARTPGRGRALSTSPGLRR